MAVIGVSAGLNVEEIVFATDFSPVSEVAEAYARALAHRFGSALEVVHVYDPARNTTYEEGILAPIDSDRMDMRRQKLTKIRNRMCSAGIATRSVLCEGHPASNELLELMKEEATDLLVIGTRSKPGVERFLLGSTAEDLIRQAKRPVFTVGPNAKPPRTDPLVFGNIVYATDFSTQAAKAASFALAFAEDSGSKLYYCHVVHDIADESEAEFVDGAFRAELKRMVPRDSREWCSPECVVEHGRAAEAILELAAKVDADLIVLGPRKPTFALKHVEQGVTIKVLAGAQCPVLTVC